MPPLHFGRGSSELVSQWSSLLNSETLLSCLARLSVWTHAGFKASSCHAPCIQNLSSEWSEGPMLENGFPLLRKRQMLVHLKHGMTFGTLIISEISIWCFNLYPNSMIASHNQHENQGDKAKTNFGKNVLNFDEVYSYGAHGGIFSGDVYWCISIFLPFQVIAENPAQWSTWVHHRCILCPDQILVWLPNTGRTAIHSETDSECQAVPADPLKCYLCFQPATEIEGRQICQLIN